MYPPKEDVLEEVGLLPIVHYVQVRRNTIAGFIVDRTIFGYCEEGRIKHRSCPRQFWWEQPMDLDAERKGLAMADNPVTASDEEWVDSVGSE